MVTTGFATTIMVALRLAVDGVAATNIGTSRAIPVVTVVPTQPAKCPASWMA
jgi:hypothetical protein